MVSVFQTLSAQKGFGQAIMLLEIPPRLKDQAQDMMFLMTNSASGIGKNTPHGDDGHEKISKCVSSAKHSSGGSSRANFIAITRAS